MKMKSMIKYISTALFLVLCMGVVSCVDDTLAERNGNNPGTTAKMTLSFTLPDQQVVEMPAGRTRNALESHIGDVYLLVFDGEDKFIECSRAMRTQNAYSYAASLSKQNKLCRVYVVANATEIIENRKGAWNSETSLTEIQSQLLMPSLLNSQLGAITEMPAVPPLVSLSPLIVEGIDGSMSYDNIFLERATAKITIANEVTGELVIEGANLSDAPIQGYVFAGQSLSSITTADYWGRIEEEYSPEEMIVRATASDPLYCYETDAAAGQSPYLIMRAVYKGVDGYYRINLIDEAKQQLSVKRNFSYLVRIKKLQNPGYRTPGEARDNLPLNAVPGNVDIDVSDSYSHDIVSNGEYYLGVENSEFIIYSAKEISGNNNAGELVTMVHYNAPGTVNQGVATIKAYDILGKTVTGGVDISNPFATSNNGSVQFGELRVKLPIAAVRADIQLRIGNLEKTIKVIRKPENLAFGGSIAFEGDYVFGKIPSSQSWLKFALLDNVDVENGVDYIENQSGGMKIHLILSANLVQNPNSENREALLYLSQANDKGRTKVKLYQPKFDIFSKEATPIENPYVGTFHRYDQTGERVIKMGGGNSSAWVAEVVAGRDFIKLLKGGSRDPQIYQLNPGDAENYQIYDSIQARTSIVGSGEILFRVGLKDRIAPGAHRYGVILVTHSGGTSRIFVRQGEAPDYLYRKDDPVLNSWTAHSGTPRPLTVKLSPYNLTDPKLGTGLSAGQAYSDHNAMPLDYHPSNIGVRKFNRKKFTEYPTQGGYFFIWNTLTQPLTGEEYPYSNPTTFKDEWQWMRAVHPVNTGSVSQLLGADRPVSTRFVNNTYSGNYSGNGDKKIPRYDIAGATTYEKTFDFSQIGKRYNTETDPCPYGYRYPKAGWVDDSSAGGPIKMYGQDAYYSELLQSMFYDPHISTNQAEMAKYTLWGYYADGFFDRRKILSPSSPTLPMNPSPSASHSIVVVGDKVTNTTTGNDIGYVGGLTFNPFNYASIFYPATGFWNYGLSWIGSGYFYWTTDRTTSAHASSVPLFLFATKGSFIIINSFGEASTPRAVRCVRDPNIPLSGHPGYE